MIDEVRRSNMWRRVMSLTKAILFFWIYRIDVRSVTTRVLQRGTKFFTVTVQVRTIMTILEVNDSCQ